MSIHKKNFDYFHALTEQAVKVRDASGQLLNLFENITNIPDKARDIHEIKQQTDELMLTIMNELVHSFITPIDREDIITVSIKLDDIMNAIEDIAHLFGMYKIGLLKKEALEIAKLIHDACEALYQIVQEFSNFKDSLHWNEIIININHIESQGTKLYRTAITTLFERESNAIEIIKWKSIFETLEAIPHYCRRAAILLYSVALKNN